MTIEFECRFCQKILSAPDDKAGSLARCPQCGETISVPVQDDSLAADAFDDFFEDVALQKTSQELVPVSETVECPMCGAVNPEEEFECVSCGEELQQTQSAQNEFQSIRAKDVFGRSWELFWQYPGVCLLGPLLANILYVLVCILMFVIGLLVFMGLSLVMPENSLLLVLPMIFLGLIALVMLLYVVAYFELGKVILFMRVAQDEQPALSNIFAGGQFTGRMVLCSLLFELLIFFANMVFVLAGYALALLFWPYPYLLVDRNLPGVESFGKAVDVTKGNLITLFLVFLSLFGLVILEAVALIGLAYLMVAQLSLPPEPVVGVACLLGVAGGLFLYSFLQLVKAVAYVQITRAG
ncbi:hypothetical protein [Gimesia panareensis]|nr:hypothetical protein [Gimesia panareensis]